MIRWKGRPTEEDTWEVVATFSTQFPCFGLEDKAVSNEGGIVMDQTGECERKAHYQVSYHRRKEVRHACQKGRKYWEHKAGAELVILFHPVTLLASAGVVQRLFSGFIFIHLPFLWFSSL